MTAHYLLLCFFNVLACFIASAVAIINGDNTTLNQFPYQVAIHTHGVDHVCGGGIIGDLHVLTAAHCVVPDRNALEGISIIIVAGTNRLQQTGPPAVVRLVHKVYVPKQYTPVVEFKTGDIAVLKLTDRLGLAHRQPNLNWLQLPRHREEYYDDRNATICGYGWNTINMNGHIVDGNGDGRLRYANATVLIHKRCQQDYRYGRISKRDLCARIHQHLHPAQSTRGVCLGDSGGPLVYDGITVIGVLKLASPTCNERLDPGVYTRVSLYLDFVKHAMMDKPHPSIRTFDIHY